MKPRHVALAGFALSRCPVDRVIFSGLRSRSQAPPRSLRRNPHAAAGTGVTGPHQIRRSVSRRLHQERRAWAHSTTHAQRCQASFVPGTVREHHRQAYLRFGACIEIRVFYVLGSICVQRENRESVSRERTLKFSDGIER